MRLVDSHIGGVYVVRGEPVIDDRGYFMRIFDADEFARRGVDPTLAQCGVSFNSARFTLRGMHYQEAPHEESKLVRCIRGSAFDVAVDLRRDSPTYLQSFCIELHAGGPDSVLIPPGCAHGFLTLEPDTELLYQIGTPYAPHHATGVRWDDPAFGIEWPSSPAVISDRDRSFPDIQP
jgi:dTDP-4-dehydrorhamnose 3,5-epimerase